MRNSHPCPQLRISFRLPRRIPPQTALHRALRCRLLNKRTPSVPPRSGRGTVQPCAPSRNSRRKRASWQEEVRPRGANSACSNSRNRRLPLPTPSLPRPVLLIRQQRVRHRRPSRRSQRGSRIAGASTARLPRALRLLETAHFRRAAHLPGAVHLPRRPRLLVG